MLVKNLSVWELDRILWLAKTRYRLLAFRSKSDNHITGTDFHSNWKDLAKIRSDIINIIVVLAVRLPSGTLMSSCQTELQELMYQLDVMLSTKKQQWLRETEELEVRNYAKDLEYYIDIIQLV